MKEYVIDRLEGSLQGTMVFPEEGDGAHTSQYTCFYDIPLSAVHVDEAGKSLDGSVWSPQLLPYDDWGTDAGYGSTESDLFQGGFLNFLTEDERDALLARARSEGNQEALSAAVVKKRSSSVGTNDDLFGAVSLRRAEEGYVLSGFDLHRFADACNRQSGLIVVLPASIDGIPVVRIAAEAFIRRNVQGVQVETLVIPPYVKRIASGAFSSLSVKHIIVGANTADIAQGAALTVDMQGVTPPFFERTYAVALGNRHFIAKEGSLYSADGTVLYALRAPYCSPCQLPGEINRVGAYAFATGTPLPRVVQVQPNLESVESKVLDDALWIVEENDVLAKSLKERGVRTASSQVVQHKGCWYDFDEKGAVLVCGPLAPRSASVRFAEAAARRARQAQLAAQNNTAPGGNADRTGKTGDAGNLAANSSALHNAAGGYKPDFQDLTDAKSRIAHTDPHEYDYVDPDGELVIPAQMEGRPVYRIARRALTHAPQMLKIPETVELIEADNTCLGLKQVVLPRSLKHIGAHSFTSRMLSGVVLIPSGVRSIGKGSFEYAVCKLEHTGSIVHIPSDQLLSSFKEMNKQQLETAGRGNLQKMPKPSGAGAALEASVPLAPPKEVCPFDFKHYDKVLLAGKSIPLRLAAMVRRFAQPVETDEQTQTEYRRMLAEQCRAVWKFVAEEGNLDMVVALVDGGLVTAKNYQALEEELQRTNKLDAVMYLMNHFRVQSHKSAPSVREKFAL